MATKEHKQTAKVVTGSLRVTFSSSKCIGNLPCCIKTGLGSLQDTSPEMHSKTLINTYWSQNIGKQHHQYFTW